MAFENNLPAGSVPFSNQIYKDENGKVWTGNEFEAEFYKFTDIPETPTEVLEGKNSFKIYDNDDPDGNSPIEIVNLGATSGLADDPFQHAINAIVKNEWSGLWIFNMKLKSDRSGWERSILSDDSGMACMEVGKEGVTLHAVPKGVPDFTGFTHEAFQVRGIGADGTSAGATDANTPIIQVKWPTYKRWTNAATPVDGTQSWIPGDHRPMDWYHTENYLKGSSSPWWSGIVVAVEVNASTKGGNNVGFYKSKGIYSNRLPNAIGDNTGGHCFYFWDGVKYNQVGREYFELLTDSSAENYTPSKKCIHVGGYAAGDTVGTNTPQWELDFRGQTTQPGGSIYKPKTSNIRVFNNFKSIEAPGSLGTQNLYVLFPASFNLSNTNISLSIDLLNIGGVNGGLTELLISGNTGSTTVAWGENDASRSATQSKSKILNVQYGYIGPYNTGTGNLCIKIVPASPFVNLSAILSKVILSGNGGGILGHAAAENWQLLVQDTDPANWTSFRTITL